MATRLGQSKGEEEHMRQRIVTGGALVCAVLWLTSCQTLSDVVQAKAQGGGTTQVYPVETDQAWTIAKTVLRWEGSDAIEEHRDQGSMLTSSGMNFLSAGAVMGAWIEPAGRGQTKVTVVTKRRMATNIATTLTETTFQKRFAQAVALVKAGQPLPLTPPE
jgi:hypothetical protein